MRETVHGPADESNLNSKRRTIRFCFDQSFNRRPLCARIRTSRIFSFLLLIWNGNVNDAIDQLIHYAANGVGLAA